MSKKTGQKDANNTGSDYPRLDRQAIASADLPDEIRSVIEQAEPSKASKAFNSEAAGWTDFFESGPDVTGDFERPEQGQQSIREGFDENPMAT